MSLKRERININQSHVLRPRYDEEPAVAISRAWVCEVYNSQNFGGCRRHSRAIRPANRQRFRSLLRASNLANCCAALIGCGEAGE
jgi:hypothetical protein